jgi:hypothetical protein
VKSTSGKASGPISFLRVFNGATEAVKQGGCVTPDTRVSTNGGLVEIGCLGPVKDDPDSWHRHHAPLLVATDNGVVPSDEFYNHGVTPVRRVRTTMAIASLARPSTVFASLTRLATTCGGNRGPQAGRLACPPEEDLHAGRGFPV